MAPHPRSEIYTNVYMTLLFSCSLYKKKNERFFFLLRSDLSNGAHGADKTISRCIKNLCMERKRIASSLP